MGLLKYDMEFMNRTTKLGGLRPSDSVQPFIFGGARSTNPPARLFRSMLAWLFGIVVSVALKLFFLVCRLARAIDPNFAVGRLVFVTRDEDAREVLENHETFGVPYAPEMKELAGGANSILGIDDARHDKLSELILGAMRSVGTGTAATMTELIEAQSAATANALLDNSDGRIDVMTDLITRTLTETTCAYFGFTVNNPEEFAHWTMTFSRLLFGDPTGSKSTHAEAMNAAPRFHVIIDQAIAAAKAAAKNREAPVGLIRALVDIQIAQKKQPTTTPLTNDRIRATVIGLIVALIPTNTLAAGKMLEELMRPKRRWELRLATELAKAGDDEALKNLLLEASRLNPALSPGLWRYVKREDTIAAGTGWWRRRKVYPNDIVLVVIPSGLRDKHRFPDNPNGFDANRVLDRELMFGHGVHYCIGDQLAMLQITQIFKALLKRDPQCAWRRPKPETIGPFPVRLDMTFAPERTKSTMIIISAPAARQMHRSYKRTFKDIETAIAALGNPANPKIAQSLKETEVVHFASLSVVEANSDHSKPPVILFEINADGERDDILRAVATHGFKSLSPIFEFVTDRVRNSPETLFEILRVHAHDLHCTPVDPTGLNFDGMRQFSVRTIDRNAKLADFARRKLDEYLKTALGSSGHASDALSFVREAIRKDTNFRADLLTPSRKILEIAAWRAPRSLTGPFFRIVMHTPTMIWAVGLILAVWIALGESLAHVTRIFARAVTGEGWWSASKAVVWTDFAVVLGSLLATIGIFIVIGIVLALLLVWHENSDKSVDRQVDLRHAKQIADKENRQTQNHIIAVMPLKRGWFRRLTLAFTFWGIKQSLSWFRPGFVATMGTIHYAKWFVVPGTDQFVFMANYNGSWESYLEDFITRVHTGQSAAWSHGRGFPMTRWLIRYGAEDGDRFKRWVRNQQRPSLFWYCRFPDLTTDQIRKNALMQDGLVRATTSTEGRAWLGTFGSEQRQESEIEADEVQSLVFSGQPQSLFMTCLLLKVPDNNAGRARWLQGLMGRHVEASTSDGLNWLELHHDKKSKVVPSNLRVSFGDHSSPEGATFLAISAAGLAKLGVPDRNGSDTMAGMDSFPPVFRLGMARRQHILGDSGASDANNWHWKDGNGDHSVDAALFVYGAPEKPDAGGSARSRHQTAVDRHINFLVDCRGELVKRMETGPDLGAWEERHSNLPFSDVLRRNRPSPIEREPFGFRDGISQPAIRGTGKASAHPTPRDVVAPGEFILGYRNNQDYFPPALTVRAADDPANTLPTVAANAPLRFPHFGRYDRSSDDEGPDPKSTGDMLDYRDFGRNGTFLVVRDLEQDVEEFNNFIEEKVTEINRDYPDLSNIIGRKVDAAWIAAKMVGRWQDGSPLVGNADGPPDYRRAGTEPDNDFSYGVDDPRGLQCPLGAHIRRANPRDSLQPGDPVEQSITNRHRLIRRGRSYVAGGEAGTKPVEPAGQGGTKGLLFACICADLERQFEFVQQSWVNAPAFHALTNEPDPLTGGKNVKDAPPPNPVDWSATFSIPTPGGAVTLKNMRNYVTARAGGYFFMPSRSALIYLISRVQNSPG